MNRRTVLQFIERHGIVLESAHGPVATFADAVAGERVRGNWWSHPMSHQIFALTRLLRDSPHVLVCRPVDGKITYVHRRPWPALVRLASELKEERLAEIRELHTSVGTHTKFIIGPFQSGSPRRFIGPLLALPTQKRESHWALSVFVAKFDESLEPIGAFCPSCH